MAITIQDNVKETYHRLYETDELWEDIDETLTFADVFERMQKGEDFYDIVGAADSVVRERIFGIIVNIFQTAGYEFEYDDIYYLWLDGKPVKLKKKDN